MADRSTLTSLALVAAAAVALPVAFGAMYSMWRSQVNAALPEDLAELAAHPPAALPEPVAEPEPEVQLREVDQVVFGFAEWRLSGARADDVAPDKSFRVDLTGVADGPATEALVDLDRDGKIDERWELKPRKVLRSVAPADDENYTERYRWTPTGWQPADAAPPAE